MSLNTILQVITLVVVPLIGAIVKAAADRNHRQQLVTHELINGRLDQALKDIAELQVKAGVPHRRVTDDINPITPGVTPVTGNETT